MCARKVLYERISSLQEALVVVIKRNFFLVIFVLKNIIVCVVGVCVCACVSGTISNNKVEGGTRIRHIWPKIC